MGPPSIGGGASPLGKTVIGGGVLIKLRKLTERYCVVYQTLASGPSLSTTMEIAKPGSAGIALGAP